MAPRAASRTQSFGTSIFSEMSALALAHGAINLSQGFPDFAGPEMIKRMAIDAIAQDRNQYAPSHGMPVLRAAVAAAWGRWYGRSIDPDAEVTITSGATEALMSAALAFFEPGDEVLLIEPYYDAYVPNVLCAGATPRFVRLREPDWTLDLDELRAAVTPRTRALMLNSPHNPTGKVFSHAELSAIAELACERDLLVISDEAYERLTFDDHVHTPIATLPGMWERTISIGSAGKTFSVTGWKIGMVVASPALTQALRSVHQFVTFASATPLQVAVAEGLGALETYEPEFRAFYRARREQLGAALEAAGFRTSPPAGTFFVMADYRALSDLDDIAFCRRLTTEFGVAAIPPSVFYHDGHQSGMVRFCFAKREETIAAAAERLAGIRERL